MDNFKIGLGGHNLLGDDLEFIELISQEPHKAIAQTLGIPLLILSGVQVTIGATISWTAGWIYINGEVCKVDAGSAAYPANTTWVISQSVDPAGTQTYQDLNVVDTYLLRRAVIQGNAGGTNHHNNAKYFRDYLLFDPPIIISALPHMQAGWSIITTDLYMWRTKFGQINFDGKVNVGSYNSSTTPVVLILPTTPTTAINYRPAGTYTVLAPAIIGGVRTFVHLEINSSTGAVTPLGLTNGTNVTIIFDGVVWPTF